MTATPTQPGQVVFYRQDGTVVTNHYFSANGHRYPIADLSHIGTVRGSVHPGTLVSIASGVVAAIGAGVVLTLTRTPLVILAAAVALLVPLLVGSVCALRWPPRRTLVAYYKGWTVTLFSTRNNLVFNQVTRALQRALETRDADALRGVVTFP